MKLLARIFPYAWPVGRLHALVRDVDGREVDFIVTEKKRPILAVECKVSASTLDRTLRYFVERFPKVDAWQITLEGTTHARTPEGITLAPAGELLSRLV